MVKPKEIKLGSLLPGEKAVVTRMEVNGLLYRRLLDLGFGEGAQVTSVIASPLGDPVVYEVRGAQIALRQSDADLVHVFRDDKQTKASTAAKASCTGRPCQRCQRRDAVPVELLVEAETDSGREYPLIALAGNPNTGKSTVFNALTGLRQHVGNWPGKTVSRAEGRYSYGKNLFRLVDLPGTYSLISNSIEEEIARDFIVFGRPECTVIVADATCLERNLNLVLQVLQVTDRAVVCVNLMDEARKNGLSIDLPRLAEWIGVPVVGTEARRGEGLDELKEAIASVTCGKIQTSPLKIQFNDTLESALEEMAALVAQALPDIPNPRWIALRLIDGGDQRLLTEIQKGVLASAQGRTGAHSLPDHIAPNQCTPWTNRKSYKREVDK